jgi:hypothetical protein
MTSGLGGGIDPVFGLFDTRLVRPVEPLSLKFYRWRRHAGTGGARSRWIASELYQGCDGGRRDLDRERKWLY